MGVSFFKAFANEDKKEPVWIQTCSFFFFDLKADLLLFGYLYLK